MITEIRQAIIERLNQTLSSRVRVVSDDTDRDSGAKAQIKTDYIARVSFAGSSFNPPDNPDSVEMQLVTRAYQISVEVQDLRTEDKTVKLLEDIELRLMGYCPKVPGVTGQFYLQSDRFQSNKDGIYFYVINLSIPCRVLKEY